jgi:hypothetical protein
MSRMIASSLALLALVGLNAALLWRRSPALAMALRGPRAGIVVLKAGGTGESNILPFPGQRPTVAQGLRLAA